jgi:probable F420-dependent oxidoreductase
VTSDQPSSPAFPRIGLLYRAIDLETTMPLPDLAAEADARGFDGIFLGEHTHIPVSLETPFIGGGDMPDTYPRLIDPYIGLAFVAAQTSLRIGTYITLLTEHDPIALAKEIATLDFMSKGRLILGIGLGWNREELANHGHAWKDRRAVMWEHLALMRSLWYEQEAEYHGQHANLERSWSWPKPKAPIPVLLGAASAGQRAIEDIVRWADGWMIGAPNTQWLAERIGALRSRWVEAGREESGPITMVGHQVSDDADHIKRSLEDLQSVGVHEVVIDVPTASREEILPILDRYAEVLTKHFSDGFPA